MTNYLHKLLIILALLLANVAVWSIVIRSLTTVGLYHPSVVQWEI